MLTADLGTLDELVLEAQWSDSRRMADLNSLEQIREIDVLFEKPQRRRDLAFVPCPDGTAERVDLGRSAEGVALHANDGHSCAPHPRNQTCDRLGRFEPAG